jgi:hypothetical protein
LKINSKNIRLQMIHYQAHNPKFEINFSSKIICANRLRSANITFATSET